MKSNSEREESIFNAARLILPVKERAKYLQQACGEDVELRQRVQGLLDIYTAESRFLETPAMELSRRALASSPLSQGPEEGGRSCLQVLGKTIEFALVSLREWGEELVEPVQLPDSSEIPNDGSDRRYQVHGEIARGGMGAILKGRDRDLGRDLAIKVLLEEHKSRPEIIRRFVEEAQIGGQLQHPGIPPLLTWTV